MADLKKIRLQVLDPENGSVKENVNVKTATDAVALKDGTLLQGWIDNTEETINKVQEEVGKDVSALEDEVESKITLGDENVNLKLTPEDDTLTLSISGLDTSMERAKLNATVPAKTITVAKTGTKTDSATIKYQWYKKAFGKDVAFTAIDGATTATLTPEKILTNVAGTTIYYCIVTASGEGVVCDPVASRKLTVIVA